MDFSELYALFEELKIGIEPPYSNKGLWDVQFIFTVPLEWRSHLNKLISKLREDFNGFCNFFRISAEIKYEYYGESYVEYYIMSLQGAKKVLQHQDEIRRFAARNWLSN